MNFHRRVNIPQPDEGVRISWEQNQVNEKKKKNEILEKIATLNTLLEKILPENGSYTNENHDRTTLSRYNYGVRLVVIKDEERETCDLVKPVSELGKFALHITKHETNGEEQYIGFIYDDKQVQVIRNENKPYQLSADENLYQPIAEINSHLVKLPTKNKALDCAS